MSRKLSPRMIGRKSGVQRQRLEQLASEFQKRYVIPHCASCSRPCCMLTDVVLEFEWPHFVSIYNIDASQREFDKALRDGSGPRYVRKMDGIYYMHGSPCPGYDQQAKTCKLYGSDLKPENCSDFPVYRDGDVLVADARCEAVDITDLLRYLRQALPDFEMRNVPDAEFPVINRIFIRAKR